MNKTSVESTAQGDNFHEVKRHKKHISNNTSQTAKKSTKPVPTSAAVKLPTKAALTYNLFRPLRTTDMNVETAGAEQEAPRKPGRPPPVMTTSTTNLIGLQSDLRDHT
jgi:hypothetical protein